MVLLGLDDERLQIDSDWYDEVPVTAFVAVGENQIQRVEEGRVYWDRRAEFARSFLSNADSPGLGVDCLVPHRNKWE